jgi:hypothetical protein
MEDEHEDVDCRADDRKAEQGMTDKPKILLFAVICD